MNLFKSIEEEQNRLNNTNYTRALQNRKVRPRDIINGLDKSNEPKEYEFASPFKSNLGNCINLKDLMPVDSEKDLRATQEPKNQVILSHRFNEVNSEDDEGRVSILENNCNDEPYIATIEPTKF